MQHTTHLFVGEGLKPFRDKFASSFRKSYPRIESPYFSALSLTMSNDSVSIDHDRDGDPFDSIKSSDSETAKHLRNFFDSMFQRKVTVKYPGNRSMSIQLWIVLYEPDSHLILRQLTEILKGCHSNINIEINGFTHDAVSCFIPKVEDRVEYEIYRQNFKTAVESLLSLRVEYGAVRLISNINTNRLALGFDEDVMARVLAEFSAQLSIHHNDLSRSVFDENTKPFESVGISILRFDRQYYFDYLRNRAFIEKAEGEKLSNRKFNINSLASRSNPFISSSLQEIKKFYSRDVVNEKARLSLSSDNNTSDLSGAINDGVGAMSNRLLQNIELLLNAQEVTVFEREAILSLILGEDCDMFETSAVPAHELVIDDLLDDFSQFFVRLDANGEKLSDVAQSTIKNVRTRMRNIAVANRQRQDHLKSIDALNSLERDSVVHISDGSYRFSNSNYRLISTGEFVPLENDYKAHPVSERCLDLRESFRPIRNQGSQGSCAAFAVSSVVEMLSNSTHYLVPLSCIGIHAEKSLL